MSLRKSFISLTSSFSSILPLGMLSGLSGHDFIVPFYHVVSDGDCPHIKHLYRYKGVKQFEQDLDYLTKYYQPVAATDLNDVISGKYKGKKTMLLTFDDGLREMYDTVAPILLRKGIPAVFFLNTDFTDNKDLMFRYKVSLLIEEYKKRGVDKRSLLNIRNRKELQEYEQIVDFKSFLQSYQPYMSTPQIKDLVSKGFSIGGHSCSHPYYADISLDQQLTQTLDSIDILQQNFDVGQRLFAFPFTDDGVSKGFFDKVFSDGKIDFSFGGAGIKNDVNPRQIQRIPMEGCDAGAEQLLKSEYLYYLLRMPLFKNTINRTA